MTRATGAVLVAALAFLLYRATLLPGLDFGDTPSFQVMAGEPVVTPRDGYPLYFAIGRLFVLTTGADWAYALNLASAVEAAIACGVVVLVAAELSGSLAAGVAAACLFAGSYTFWSQAVLAEVYALHIGLVASTLLFLLRWDNRPTIARLAGFFAVYALAFGNHLTMILLAPAYGLFILTRKGWRSVLTVRTITLAAAFAAIGALPYLWNLHALWLAPLPPHNLGEALRSFWFDVTKSDWRSSMVLSVPARMTADRLRMYAFDVSQQFGWPGLVLAAAGFLHLVRTSASRALLLLTIYLSTAIFALSYSVGDTHVFLLPSHLMIALVAAPGIVWAAGIWPTRQPAPPTKSGRHSQVVPGEARLRGAREPLLRRAPRAVTLVAVVVAVAGIARIYREYPALDRSQDKRPAELLQALTAGIDDRHGVLLTDLNWQIENGLNYFAKRVRNDVAWARMNDVILYAPILIRDNLAINRRVFLTERAAAALLSAYGPLFSTVPDPSVPPTAISDLARDLPPGTRYALCVLRPPREIALNEADLEESLQILTGHHLGALPPGDYTAIAGLAGDEPLLVRSDGRPFRADVTLAGVPVTVRMDSWLAFDTIRRMGFGHVIAARKHSLIVERGVSFVAFDATGRPLRLGYAGGLFGPQPRFLIEPSALSSRLSALGP